MARALISMADEAHVELLYPVHAIKDVFYTIQSQLKHQERAERGALSESAVLAIREIAWDCVRNMSENATAVGADGSDVWLAMKLRSIHNDLEDNLVLAAAQRARVDMLVTNDERLILKATVPAHTPADALALLQM